MAQGDGVANPKSTELVSSGAGIPSLIFLVLCPVLGILFLEARQKLSQWCRWRWEGEQSSCCTDPSAGRAGILGAK